MRYFVEIVFTVLLLTTLIKGQRQGDLCVMAGTIQPGVCRHVMRCPAVLEAVLNGLPYQVCASPENRLIVCCPWVPGQETRLESKRQANTTTPREGDNCTMVDAGRAGVCSRFANCQIAKETAYKGVSPQICAVEGTVQIVCCPLKTVAEGDQCTLAETGRAGKCLRISKCPVAVEAALKGITPQICALDGSVPVVCCEGVVEGDACTMVKTGRPGVCSRFSNCQTAKEAAYKGISPQICAVEDTVQIVCCPPVIVVEGDNCTVVDTGRPGVCRPFANCQTAKEATSKGILPQTCDVKGTLQIVCCPLVAVVEGSNCTLKDTGKAGVCRPFASCQSAKEAACKGIFQQKCDLTDIESELVCCVEATFPPLPKGLQLLTQLPTGSKAANYCVELTKKIQGDMCPLLTPDSNIVYFQTPMTTAAEAPYYGRFGSYETGNITWLGNPVTLVSDQWVLGSARFLASTSSSVQVVGLGGTFSPRYNPDEKYGITTTHMHPLYNNQHSFVYNDIALLRLDRQVVFTRRILPACLHTGTPTPNSDFILTGWDGTPLPDFKTTVQILSQEECSRVFPTAFWFHPAGFNHDLEICSRSVHTKEDGRCVLGHHGSPLTLPNSPRVTCTHLLVGLKSWSASTSSPCTDPNTRISSFVTWIEGIVWPETGVV